jgi:hypothetical protein
MPFVHVHILNPRRSEPAKPSPHFFRRQSAHVVGFTKQILLLHLMIGPFLQQCPLLPPLPLQIIILHITTVNFAIPKKPLPRTTISDVRHKRTIFKSAGYYDLEVFGFVNGKCPHCHLTPSSKHNSSTQRLRSFTHWASRGLYRGLECSVIVATVLAGSHMNKLMLIRWQNSRSRN